MTQLRPASASFPQPLRLGGAAEWLWNTLSKIENFMDLLEAKLSCHCSPRSGSSWSPVSYCSARGIPHSPVLLLGLLKSSHCQQQPPCAVLCLTSIACLSVLLINPDRAFRCLVVLCCSETPPETPPEVTESCCGSCLPEGQEIEHKRCCEIPCCRLCAVHLQRELCS